MTTRKQSTPAPVLNSTDNRISNKEVIDQEVTKEQDNKPTKPVAKPKEAKAPLFTCYEAMGIVMKANPKSTAEVIINKADTLYIKRTGKESNIFQMAKYYRFASYFLRGYNAK